MASKPLPPIANLIERLVDERASASEVRRVTELLKRYGKGNLAHTVATLRQNEKGFDDIGDLAQLRKYLSTNLTSSMEAWDDQDVDVENLLAPLPIVDGAKRARVIRESHVLHGRTTFVSCGKCAYAYQRMSNKVRCSFLNGFIPDQSAAPDTPCIVRRFSPEEYAKLVHFHDERLAARKRQREYVRHKITHLRVIKAAASASVPLLVANRRTTHFNFGDRVLVYIPNPIIPKTGWVWATVTRQGGERVPLVLDDPLLPAKKRPDHLVASGWEQYAWDAPIESSFILHEWEFHALSNPLADRRFRARWLSDANVGRFVRHPVTEQEVKVNYTQFTQSLVAGVFITSKNHSVMMSAEVACEYLNLSGIPRYEDEVVDAYRRQKERPTYPELEPHFLKRAKDTLLIRIQGCEVFHD